ncbi:MAG: hypothetical protein WBL45_02950 [Solirubrobacterales bacterium]
MIELREKILRSVSLVITDRRWSPTLAAMALGFGLFLGVAIGPGASGTFATPSGQIVAVAPSSSEAPAEESSAANEPEPFTEPESEPFETEESFEPYYPETEYPVEPAPEKPVEEAPPNEEPEEEEPEGQLLEGTVVHANPAAGSYTMAIAGGELVSIHAPKLPPPGTKLKVEGNPLANNTFGEASRERSGGSRRAEFRGVVTFVDPDPLGPSYTVSGRGSSILVHAAPGTEAQLPALGAYATVSAQIEKPASTEAQPLVPPTDPAAPPIAPTCAADPALKPPPEPAMIAAQRSLEVEPEPATYLDLAGILTAICPTTGQIAISADDLRESGKDLVLSLPGRLKTTGFELGDSIVATATIGEDGTLTLAGLASDERTQGAEDTGSAQGDLKR